MNYRKEIDGLRAVAVLPVILFHAGFSAFPGGYVGVDVFFVISGYLITGILIDEIRRGEYSVLRFYERRARRILPALFGVLLICIPFAWMWLLPEQLSDFAASLASVLVFISNIYFMSQVSYFAPTAELLPLLHTWSLAVEEQYYLLFPLIVAGSLRFGLRALFAVTLILTLSSLALSEAGLRMEPGRNFFFTLSRFWELGVGSLCAVVSVWRSELRNGPLAILGLMLILGAVFLYGRSVPFAGLYALVPVCGAALIVLFCRADTLAGRMLSHPFPVGIGLISYSAYLYHQPLFAFARIRSAEEPGLVLLSVLCLASLGRGWLSWRFVERPFRGARATILPYRRHFGAVFAATASALFVVAVAIYAKDGYPGRVVERFAGEIGNDAFFRDAEERFYPCTPDELFKATLRYEGRPRCLQSRPDQPATVAVVGDSHAEHLFAGIAGSMPDDVVVIYLQDTVPFRSAPEMQDIYAEIERNKNLKTVVFAMHWPRRFAAFDDEVAFRTELRSTLSGLQHLGVMVLVAGDLPWFVSEPPNCKYEVFEGNLRYCTAERADSIEAKRSYGPILADVTSKLGIPLVPVRDLFCDDDACSMVRDGVILYRDSNHLNTSGAEVVGAKVAEEVLSERRRADAP
ncbi:acyltransferase family protein [Tabrizicola sp.]|uniref:acyltransferase family protein n=1 Tax=Tabrizicola sp. TaxID=2005166 RepID=UPI003F2E4519